MKTFEQDLFQVRLNIMDFEGVNVYWNDLDGSYMINNAFYRPVEINEIDVFDVKIDHGGATVIISFDLIDELPNNLPVKWGKGIIDVDAV